MRVSYLTRNKLGYYPQYTPGIFFLQFISFRFHLLEQQIICFPLIVHYCKNVRLWLSAAVLSWVITRYKRSTQRTTHGRRIYEQ